MLFDPADVERFIAPSPKREQTYYTPERVAMARERDAPPEVLDVIRKATPEIDAAIAELRSDRNAVLSALSEADTMKLLATRFRSEVAARQDAAVSAARVAADGPIWDPEIWAEPLGGDEGRAAQRRHIRALSTYFVEHGTAVAGWFLGVLFLAFVLLRGARSSVSDFLRDDAGSTRAGAGSPSICWRRFSPFSWRFSTGPPSLS